MRKSETLVEIICPTCREPRWLLFRKRGDSIICRSCSMKAARKKNDWCFKHGETKTSLHGVWTSMLTRCRRSGYKYSPYYFDRGIRVSLEWHDYANFREWSIASGYRQGLTLDRIDNNCNYGSDNCRWVTQAENNQNRPSTKLNMADACVIRDLTTILPGNKLLAALYGVSRNAIYAIRHGDNWPDAEMQLVTSEGGGRVV